MAKASHDIEGLIRGTLASIEAIKASRHGPPPLSDAQIEREAEIPQGWLRKTRKGLNRDVSAMESLKRIVAWVAKNEVKAPGRTNAPRNPMSTLVAAFEPVSGPAGGMTDPELVSLSMEIEQGTTAKKLGAILRRLASGAASGLYNDLELVETLKDLTVRQAKLVKEAREERALRQVRSLEILTPGALEALRKYRGTLAGPPAKPGEYIEPPPELPPETEDGGA